MTFKASFCDASITSYSVVVWLRSFHWISGLQYIQRSVKSLVLFQPLTRFLVFKFSKNYTSCNWYKSSKIFKKNKTKTCRLHWHKIKPTFYEPLPLSLNYRLIFCTYFDNLSIFFLVFSCQFYKIFVFRSSFVYLLPAWSVLLSWAAEKNKQSCTAAVTCSLHSDQIK